MWFVFLFAAEHVKSTRRRMAPDYSKLVAEPMYVHHVVGNIMFSGKLIAASANFGCFMTMGMSGASPVHIPDNFRVGACRASPCADSSFVLLFIKCSVQSLY